MLIVPSGADFDSLTAEGAEALLRSARANPAEVAQVHRGACQGVASVLGSS